MTAADKTPGELEIEQAPFKLTKGIANLDAGSRRHWAGAMGRFANTSSDFFRWWLPW